MQMTLCVEEMDTLHLMGCAIGSFKVLTPLDKKTKTTLSPVPSSYS
jgi:hypothetical protein